MRWSGVRPSTPLASTGMALIESVPRSVTMSALPSGVKPTWAGSASGASACSVPATGSRPAVPSRKPTRPGLPVASTYTRPACSAMLFGAPPAGERPTSSRPPSSATANTLTSSLPTLATRRCPPSDVRTTEPWDVRCGLPSPAPPVVCSADRSRAPLDARRYATTLFSGSFVWTYTEPTVLPFDICPPVGWSEFRETVLWQAVALRVRRLERRAKPRSLRESGWG